MIDVLIVIMLVSIMAMGIIAVKYPKPTIYNGGHGQCKEHNWIEDSGGNLYCAYCNKMPFEVPADQAPVMWWRNNLKK